MSSKKALILSTIQGHASIGEAVSEGLQKNGWETKTYSFTDPAIAVYRWIYRHAAWLCYYYYKVLFWPLSLSLISWYTKKTHRAVFEQAMKEFPAELVVSTSYGFDSLVAEWQEKLKEENHQLPFYVNMVVDPRTFFPVNLSPHADANAVFDSQTAMDVKKLRPTLKVAETGWFVRQRFTKNITKHKQREELGLQTDVLTILIVAGSEGETKSAKLVHPLLHQEKPLQIILACGSNKKLKARFDHIATGLSAEGNKHLVVLPFTKEIDRYMHAADLIVGKAGPNMIFESATVGTPFFATTHIAGQEDGNLDLIHEYKLGYVEENLVKAEKLLLEIVNNPEQLKTFSPHLQKLAELNTHSIDKLLSFIKK